MDNPAQGDPNNPHDAVHDYVLDDPHDATYKDAAATPAKSNAIGITPTQRKRFAEDFSLAGKRRVDKIEGKDGRCVVTNTPANNGVQYAHLLPRGTESELLDVLEYNWGMEWATLHVDSRYNVMRLHIHLHYLFDRNDWILLPEVEIIDKLTQATTLITDRKRRQTAFQTIFNGFTTFNYKLVATPSMTTVPFLRYRRGMSEGTVACKDDFEVHFYPFNDLPILMSHVRPHFVICNLGIKMRSNTEVFAQAVKGADKLGTQSLVQRLSNCTALFNLWTQSIPSSSDFFHDYFPRRADEDDTDNNSTFTKRGRLDSSPVLRRRGNDATATSPSATSSRKRLRRMDNQDSDALWEDDETLREVEDIENPAKRLKEKMERVSDWLSNVSDHSTE